MQSARKNSDFPLRVNPAPRAYRESFDVVGLDRGDLVRHNGLSFDSINFDVSTSG